MNEKRPKRDWVRIWKRLRPLAVFLLITFGTLNFLKYLIAGKLFSEYKTSETYIWVCEDAGCWIVSSMISGWLIYRMKMDEADSSPVLAAFGSAIFVFVAMMFEIFLLYLIEICLKR